ncbi:class I SAM-dependent methyltransferase [Candidatus Solincola tengchongensis]|uniref:class I SAM-dependent methyltransferase n=1 Tax=Candidatus Solincola tengchongensis TaxID=2900693 RepID=UPI002580D58D|nr:class I SAM-dependent methyltransferase [Candidatus Solincola tengchongensis]
MRGKKALYRWDAEDYRSFSSQQKKWGLELMDKLHLRGDEHVLDLGCGDGLLSAMLAKRVPRGSVLGVDISPEMIDHARRSYPSSHYPNLAWEVADACQLDFCECFDVVFSNAVLHWIRDQSAALEGIARALKPGGFLLAQMAGRGNAAEVACMLVSLMASEKWSAYFRDMDFPYLFHGPEDYIPLLEKAGLEPLRVELLTKDMVHEGREGMAGWIRTTWLPFTQRVPERLREDFIAELVDGYLHDFPPDEAGLVHVNAVRLEVEARKPL